MDSETILTRYDWTPGICFRHPSRGQTDTTRIKDDSPDRRAGAGTARLPGLRPRVGGHEETGGGAGWA
ncbi:hypothetical protein GCM10020367_59690 [Streptomyces sannanensis]|uniref:Uncharacterized protein n=1 Tax=Streptomyces sannanensis TaxID=285536 RepID=A0ABP6SKE0_9ACTN